MATRRDQLQSYQFAVQRAVSALVLRETDPAQTPLRRMTSAAFIGIMVAVISLAAVGIFGIIRPGGNQRWQDGKSVIVEKETGTRYVFVEGRLHPVANFASARLLLPAAATIGVSQKSLAGFPRGQRLGIEDAPDALPAPDRLLTGSWSLCSLPTPTVSGGSVQRTVLAVGEDPQPGPSLNQTQALLVRDVERGVLSLVVRNRRHPLPASEALRSAVVEALGLQLTTPVDVGTAWLNALPAGASLEPVPRPDRGRPSTAVPEVPAKAGDLFVVNGDRYYLVLADRLRPLTDLQRRILQAADRTVVARPLSVGDASRARKLTVTSDPNADPPRTRPAVVDFDGGRATVCATYRDARSRPVISAGPTAVVLESAIATPRVGPSGVRYADAILIGGGSAALVQSWQASSARTGPLQLVSGGKRYPVPSLAALASLGYADVTAVPMPAALVDQIPPGSALDPDAARRPTAAG